METLDKKELNEQTEDVKQTASEEPVLTASSGQDKTNEGNSNNSLKALQERIEQIKQLPKKEHNPENVIEVNHLVKYFPIKVGLFSRLGGYVRAVDDVSFNVKRGTTMGLVGESGCGKTTVGKTLLRLNDKTAGHVMFNGVDIHELPEKELRKVRPKIQMIFQDPYSSLSPRLPIAEIIGEAVREHNIVPKEELDDYLDQVMKQCGLQPYHKDRYPHEFSGGQRPLLPDNQELHIP